MTATSMVQITHLSKEEMSPAEFTCNKKALALDQELDQMMYASKQDRSKMDNNDDPRWCRQLSPFQKT